jgi:hypothetical protein
MTTATAAIDMDKEMPPLEDLDDDNVEEEGEFEVVKKKVFLF